MTLINVPRRLFMIGLPLLVWIGCSVLAFSPGFPLQGDALSTGITLDLALTAPLLYFLVIRGTLVPKMTVVRVFIAGILLAGLLLRNRPHFLLSFLKTWLAPAAEGVLLFIVAKKFRGASRSVQALGEEEKGDFLSQCRVLLKEVTGNEKAGGILASEMAVFYYGFLPRKKREDILAQAFTSYKTNGILLILGVFLCCFFVETAGVHFLIALWSKKAAWVLTALSAYTVLQLYAHMRAVRSRPVLVGEHFLQLRNGLASDACVRIDNIGHIEVNRSRGVRVVPPNAPGKKPSRLQGEQVSGTSEKSTTVELALLKIFENPNILIRLKQPVLVNRPFGIRQEASAILLFVDRPEEFLSAVQEKRKA